VLVWAFCVGLVAEEVGTGEGKVAHDEAADAEERGEYLGVGGGGRVVPCFSVAS
jgi:hypothetical protein